MRRRTTFHGFELDRTTYPDFRDAILAFGGGADLGQPRSYPGYPRVSLPAVRPRLWPSLDRAMLARRSPQRVGTSLPSRRDLSRVLRFGHGALAEQGRGPVPSAGGLQTLELYVAVLAKGWLDASVYHYDRIGHFLSRVAEGIPREKWDTMVPSLKTAQGGGGLLWILAGDGACIAAKYGERGRYFLLLEAGHLMQNLCLLSASLNLATVPLGGFFENEIAAALNLPPGDAVLYLGLCGANGAR